MTAVDAVNAGYDVLIIGSGAGGCAAAYQLAKSRLRVAIVEKGAELPRDNSTLDVDKVIHQRAFRSRECWRDGRGREIVPEEYFNVGGKTKWYGAALLRFARHEFDADPAHQCLAWPLRYEELAPYYDLAEQLLGPRCFPVESDLGRILRRLAAVAPRWYSEPLPLGLSPAILRNPREASHFDGFASVADLKSDAETSFLARIRQLSTVALFTGSPVVELVGDAGDAARISGVQLGDGRILRASAVLLAAGALHSPRLLQRYLARRSLGHRLPGHAQIGRNLKMHLLTAVVALSPTRKTDLLRKTALLLDGDLPHSSVQPLGFDGELIATLIPKFVPSAIARVIADRAYGFFLQTEDGSHPDNRVQDADSDMPTLDYDASRTGAALAEHARLLRSFRWALAKTGLVALSQRIGVSGTAHVCGTLVSGTDPGQSVVDGDGRVHGLRGLWVVDGSVLPRSSRVNPSLTIYAWALRVADRLLATGPARASERSTQTTRV
jgi:choline dehydrogenase-like flavoprotein